MVELVDMLVLGTSEEIRGGSNPSIRIFYHFGNMNKYLLYYYFIFTYECLVTLCTIYVVASNIVILTFFINDRA